MNLIGSPFTGPDGQTLHYAVGQPMGAKSSWAMFTLSHHLVVQTAAYKAGFGMFNGYILLGDDIVINHDRVALEYLKIIRGLGVEVSVNKTHTSFTTYEFAKR